MTALVLGALLLDDGLPAHAAATSGPVFTDITDEAGVHVAPQKLPMISPVSSPDFALYHGSMVWQHHAGVALEDLDGDGKPDLLICDTGKLHLFKGDGHGKFRPAPKHPVLLLRGPMLMAQGVALGDVNNDGTVDIYVGVVNGPNHLFLNRGRWEFEEVAERAGVAHGGIAQSVNMVDYNNDGWLDLFVCNYGIFLNNRLHLNLQLHGDPEESQGGILRQRNVLYRNNRDGTFTDVAVQAGLGSADLSLASAWSDYDGDGDQDLYVANDFGLNRFYRNNGDGTFTEMTAEMGYLDPGYGMSVFWGDVNNDGRLDLLVGNMYSHSAHRLMQENHAEFSTLPPVVRTVFERGVSGNTLLIQQPDGTFKNEAPPLKVDDGSWAWGSVLADFNNDGWLDIYVANGWTRGEKPADYCATMWGGVMEGLQHAMADRPVVPAAGGGSPPSVPPAASQSFALRQHAEALIRAFTGETSPSARDVEALLPLLDARGNLDIDLAHIPKIGDLSWDGYNTNCLFMNPGVPGQPFRKLEKSPVLLDDISRTVATGDIDNDGDVDMVVVSTTREAAIFRNDSPPQHWLKVLLQGTKSNRSAIGARVFVTAQGKRWLRDVASGSGYCSHQSLELEFGLGDTATVDQVEVHWPSGTVQVVPHPSVNTRHPADHP